MSVSATADLRCELVTDFARLQELSAQWDRLCRSSSSEIFQLFAWTRAYWKTRSSKLSVCSPAVHNGVELVGILPLVSYGNTIRFMAEGDYNDLICEERRAPTVLALVMEALFKMPHWRTCALDNLSADSRIVRHLSALPPALRRKVDLVFACPCHVIVAAEGQNLFARLARKESLRRHQNKLQREGRLTFRHVESREEIREHLPSFFEQQVARRAMLGQRSHFHDPDVRAFYAALVEELNPRSELRFAVLELDGLPIAYHFGFQLHGKFIYYQPTFNVDFWHYSPGEVLIRKLLEYAQAAGLREFDFTIGGEMYKNRFANVTRQNLTLYVERNPKGAARFRRPVIQATRTARQIREVLKARSRLYRTLKRTWFSTADFVSQQRRLLRGASPLGYAGLALGRILRSVVFAWDEALVFTLGEHELYASDSSQKADAPLELRPCRFSELALLSSEYPEEFPGSKLHAWRERMAKGDRIYTLRSNGKLAHLIGAGTHSSLLIAELGKVCQIPLSIPAMVLDNCWTAPSFRGLNVWPTALRLLAQKVGDKPDVWTYCVNPDARARREIEAAGFRLRSRVVQIRVLHALHRNWILHAEP